MLIFIGPRRQTHILRTMQRDERMPSWITRTYSWLYRTRHLPAGTYIFVGIDRLDPGERRMAGQFYRHINSLGEGFRALNDPARAKGRYRLLRTLFEHGINDFNAYLVAEDARPQRYPVFIRRNSASTAPLTELLPDRKSLDREIDRLLAMGEVDEDLIIIEYCAEEVSPGVFLKQAEYRIGDRYAPNSSVYSNGWYVKYANRIVVGDDIYRADTALLRENRFAAVAKAAFALADIEYGRADIGIVGGRPQIYEINFNPDIRTQRERPHENALHRANWTISDDVLFDAMRTIDNPRGPAARTLSTPELTAFRLRFWRNYAPQRY